MMWSGLVLAIMAGVGVVSWGVAIAEVVRDVRERR